MEYVCSICGVKPRPCDSPGSWECDCIYDPVSGKGHWDDPKLVPDASFIKAISPVSDNPDEDAFYDKID